MEYQRLPKWYGNIIFLGLFVPMYFLVLCKTFDWTFLIKDYGTILFVYSVFFAFFLDGRMLKRKEIPVATFLLILGVFSFELMTQGDCSSNKKEQRHTSNQSNNSNSTQLSREKNLMEPSIPCKE